MAAPSVPVRIVLMKSTDVPLRVTDSSVDVDSGVKAVELELGPVFLFFFSYGDSRNDLKPQEPSNKTSLSRELSSMSLLQSRRSEQAAFMCTFLSLFCESFSVHCYLFAYINKTWNWIRMIFGCIIKKKKYMLIYQKTILPLKLVSARTSK